MHPIRVAFSAGIVVFALIFARPYVQLKTIGWSAGSFAALWGGCYAVGKLRHSPKTGTRFQDYSNGRTLFINKNGKKYWSS